MVNSAPTASAFRPLPLRYQIPLATIAKLERLTEKNEVVGYCATQYKKDKTIEMLVKECAKYEEQAVVKQQAVAECQLAAFNYANALRALKTEYRK
jgi:hypothetical protein